LLTKAAALLVSPRGNILAKVLYRLVGFRRPAGAFDDFDEGLLAVSRCLGLGKGSAGCQQTQGPQIDKYGAFTLLPPTGAKLLRVVWLCGSKSGRDRRKITTKPVLSEHDLLVKNGQAFSAKSVQEIVRIMI
jgi:hypothetical protein